MTREERALARLWSETRAQAREDWFVGTRGVWLWLVLPVLGVAIAGVLSVAFKPEMRFLEQEDGILETIQVIAFAAAAVTAALLVPRHLAAGRRLAAVGWAVLALGFVFVTGEELAWGQRFLNFETPEALAAVNEKEEVSLHNIEALTTLFTVVKLVAGLYALLGAMWLLRLRREGRDAAWRPFLVPAFLVSPFAIVVLMHVMRLTVLGGRIPTGFSETEETVLAVGMSAFCVLYWRAARRASSRCLAQ